MKTVGLSIAMVTTWALVSAATKSFAWGGAAVAVQLFFVVNGWEADNEEKRRRA